MSFLLITLIRLHAVASLLIPISPFPTHHSYPSLAYSFLSVPSLLIIHISLIPTHHSYQSLPYSSFISIISLLIIHINHFPTHHSYQSLPYSSLISIPSLLIISINPLPVPQPLRYSSFLAASTFLMILISLCIFIFHTSLHPTHHLCLSFLIHILYS